MWLDENQLKMEHPLVQELRLSLTKPQFPVIPWSCCNVEYPLQCFHDPFQQTESSYLWKDEPSVIEESIYNKGCLNILTRPIEAASTAFLVITCCSFVILNTAIFLIRILYTSSRNNVILQHSSGIAPGWLFGRGDCGWSHGPTLDQIMIKVLQKPRVENIDDKGTSVKSKSSSKTRDPKYDKMSNFSKMIHQKRKVQTSKKQPKHYKSDEEPVSSGEEKALMLK
ncbi:hypothetical protein FQR65_LT06185 [Abscondita terminalis]|nr:hypothetical protein FQR65_LT06185 [Abscondita terminalis]